MTKNHRTSIQVKQIDALFANLTNNNHNNNINNNINNSLNIEKDCCIHDDNCVGGNNNNHINDINHNNNVILRRNSKNKTINKEKRDSITSTISLNSNKRDSIIYDDINECNYITFAGQNKYRDRDRSSSTASLHNNKNLTFSGGLRRDSMPILNSSEKGTGTNGGTLNKSNTIR